METKLYKEEKNQGWVDKNLKKLREFLYNRYTIVFFVLLSLLMVICGSVFNIYDWIDHPQFTETVSGRWFDANTDTFQKSVFKTFFILDSLWAPLLLLYLLFYVHGKTKRYKWVFWLQLFFAFISLVLDFRENYQYFTYAFPSTVVILKNAAYSVTMGIALLTWLVFYFTKELKMLRHFLASAWISIFFLGLIGVALAKAPQMNSIIVTLYYQPFWFVFVFLLIFVPIYSIVLSHYPTYFSHRTSKSWRISRQLRLFGTRSIFGIVWYQLKSGKDISNAKKDGFLRRVLGVLFYGAMFYVFAYTADTNFTDGIKYSRFSFILIIGLIWWL